MPTERSHPHPPHPLHRLRAERAAHWARTRRLTGLLLAAWLATTFCTVFFARDLAHLSVFGWPLSFYLAAQGASLAFLAIIGFYAWRMQAIDRRYHAALREGEQA
jgi:putative solute:sodium symporter small subunit